MVNLQFKKDILYHYLKQSILSGKYASGEKLPKEELFSNELGVSRETLRVVLRKLESEDLILRLKSKGTFVRNNTQLKKRFLVIAELHGSSELPCHSILPGIERAANEMNIEVEICDIVYFNMQSSEEVAIRLKTRNISGIILVANNFIGDEKIMELLKGHNVPVLLPFASRKDYQITGWATFAHHERAAWREAFKHLKMTGHRRIMTLTLRLSNIRGYSLDEHKELLGELGADPSEELIACCPFDSEAIHKAVKKAFDLPHPPTAIMCYSDFWAPEVYAAVKEAGLRIPEDIAVMGFVSGFNCEYMHPALSTVHVDFSELGYNAVKTLSSAEKWFKPDDSSSRNPFLIFEYKLQGRESTTVKRFEGKIRKRDFALQNI